METSNRPSGPVAPQAAHLTIEPLAGDAQQDLGTGGRLPVRIQDLAADDQRLGLGVLRRHRAADLSACAPGFSMTPPAGACCGFSSGFRADARPIDTPIAARRIDRRRHADPRQRQRAGHAAREPGDGDRHDALDRRAGQA